MGRMIAGAIFGVLAVLAAVGGSGLGFVIMAVIGGVLFARGYGPWAAERTEHQTRLATIEAQKDRERRDEAERQEAERRAKADADRREKEFQATQQQIASSSGRQNLRRLVNELIEYAGTLRADADNASTMNGMTDTLSRLSADESIEAAHKADPNIQHDVDDVLEQLAEIGPSGNRVANRLRRLLKDAGPVAVTPSAAAAPSLEPDAARLRRLYGEEPDEKKSNWQ